MVKICDHCGLGKRKFLDKFIKQENVYYHKDCLEIPEKEYDYREKHERRCCTIIQGTLHKILWPRRMGFHKQEMKFLKSIN